MRDKFNEIKEKYKSDIAKQNEETRKLLKETNFNPFAGLAPMIIQIIIFIALYQVLKNIIKPEGLISLYSFISSPGKIVPSFLKFFDLSKPNAFFAVLTGIVQYVSTKMTFDIQLKSQKKQKPKNRQQQLSGQNKQMEMFQNVMQKQMIYFLPVMTFFIVLTLPSALSLYWFFSTLLAIIQQKIILRSP